MASINARGTTNGGRSPSFGPVVGVASLALTVGVVAWVAAVPRVEPARPIVEGRVGRGPAAQFVGDRACGECHAEQAARHGRSGHSKTLRPAGGVDVARWLDGRAVADPERPGLEWRYSLRDGQLAATRADARGEVRMVLDYALGSGRHATTFVSLVEDPSGSPASRESRLSYFAHGPTLGITPGQKASDRAAGVDATGRGRGPGATLHCFGCHATTVSDRSPAVLDAATLRPNVGCERCHGPGAEHAEAARRGTPGAAPPFDKVWSAEGQMALCGDCHRHPSQAPPGEIRPDNLQIVRFQPVGLMQSRCYRRSDGGLSCVTCHDPHDRPSIDRAAYAKACLKCHESTPRPDACREPRPGGCVDCHMPAVDAGSGIPYTDHWIRARPAAFEGPLPKGRPDRPQKSP